MMFSNSPHQSLFNTPILVRLAGRDWDPAHVFDGVVGQASAAIFRSIGVYPASVDSGDADVLQTAENLDFLSEPLGHPCHRGQGGVDEFYNDLPMGNVLIG